MTRTNRAVRTASTSRHSSFARLRGCWLLIAATLALCAGSADDRRECRFAATEPAAAEAWQRTTRQTLFDLLKLADLHKSNAPRDRRTPGLPLNAKTLDARREENHTRFEIEFDSTPTRRIRAVVTIPAATATRPAVGFPAVVCIHGHGGNADVVYDTGSIYHGFARALADSGYVTISAAVGQHQVYEPGRTLMGERLWDVMRCVDYLTTRDDVDAARLGCAGLSLGGEMAMWLGAMDPRMRVTVSSGFLTTVANMRRGHCPCWEFDGLTARFDFADIYSLTAPRALLCQIGELERAPGGFPVDLARPAMEEIRACYRVFGSADRAVLRIHPRGHEFENDSALEFIAGALR
ncbi:MAG: hypothetical protein CHACPFDD_01773 [Phycisphaerae bacterium]|nr:hypothetical protein [Phycisphaerae bacterium]